MGFKGTLLTFILLISVSSYAKKPIKRNKAKFKKDIVNCKKPIGAVADSQSLKDLIVVYNNMNIDLLELTDRLCAMARRVSYTSSSKKHWIKEILEKELKVKESDPNYKKTMSNFWNKYQHRFICSAFPDSGFPRREHIFKRIIHDRYTHVLDDFFFDEDLIEVDWNVVEVHNGKKETLIDYLDHILKTERRGSQYDLDEVREIRDGLREEYGAKRASEL